MSELKKIREAQHLTQEELAEKSGLSVRTIQRIEAGTQPKGYTLKTLANSLNIAEKDLLTSAIPEEEKNDELFSWQAKEESANYAAVKIINLSSLPLAWLPVANFLLPLLLMYCIKDKSMLAKQIISLQIFLSVIFPVIFMAVVFMKLGHASVTLAIVLLTFANIYIILRNAYEIDRKRKLFYKLNFSLL
ncbi:MULTISPECIES: helix-turn-helix domain-containing protein [Chryseobacterium]|uniref:Transcriptional regulator with XRE-family HTH domain n=1 Tax=Chryseobacterium camelliae TaxID=1265445 RepID=A0ABU0TDU8_9FLAO|nr:MULTISPECIES: helix-turn-helix domain-containing protein [Chryseobacterium]MDT3407198.1 transcriptional regulator with XRE-family HTH domain [Pseudacidovorax intermedius]MDQ1095011.1 transcriptional regulator with XRE-family HTH domain [Chryseobacterium camelliae]MDQ1098951.1 transcriptional regulator with XRE-family HTH domain [Chryseobacterium sp. SORGH_AS_1048]MDR6086299.1 transcriptional regulator with XRE-family HTH domain [Chryseobacterium sp. SORGH_AS_0909]MDR6130671.1 transcriptiona